MSDLNTAIFCRALQRLQHWCPPTKPLTVRRIQEYDCCGELNWYDGEIIIRIDADPRQERETLIHEWAHALTYNESRPEQRITLPSGDLIVWSNPRPWVMHGEEWGIAYARCYRAAQIPVTSQFGPDHPEMDYRV